MFGVTIYLLRRGYTAAGIVSLVQTTTTRTNDLGEYRMYWVTPGRYSIRAESSGGSGVFGIDPAALFAQDTQRGNNAVVEGYARTYFPGVDEESRAGAIDVASGAEMRGIDFTVTPARLYGIRGRLVDSATGQAPRQASIRLLSGNGASSSLNWYNASTGTIRIDNVTPGTYTLTASPSTELRFGNVDPSQARATAVVVIRDKDAEDVFLTMGVPALIRGRIRVEGELPPSVALRGMRVTLVKMEGGQPTGASIEYPTASATDDGTFSLAATPGEFRATLLLPSGLFLKEARLDGRDVLNDSSPFSTAGELELIISSRGGNVEGTVRDSQRRPMVSVQTVLVPNDQRNRPELFKRTLSDRNGRFSISGIAPGGYRLYAWGDLETYSYFDPEVLKKFEGQGTPVQIAESSAQTLDVDVILSGAQK